MLKINTLKSRKLAGHGIMLPPIVRLNDVIDTGSSSLAFQSKVAFKDAASFNKPGVVFVIGTSLSTKVLSARKLLNDFRVNKKAVFVSVNVNENINCSALFDYKFTCTADNFAKEMAGLF